MKHNLHTYEMPLFKRKTKAYKAFEIFIAQKFMSNNYAAVILTTVPAVRLSTHHWSCTSTRNWIAKIELTLAATYFHSRHKKSVQTADNRTTELQNELHLKPINPALIKSQVIFTTISFSNKIVNDLVFPDWFSQSPINNGARGGSQLNRRLIGLGTVFCPPEPTTHFYILA